MMDAVLARRFAQVLYDEKWKRFLMRARIFRHMPFVDFVLASGSMAIGNVSKDSDFDVIVGVKLGRMFTARFLLIVLLDMLGWRRKNLDHGASAADTICLNHFVTEASYWLSLPHEPYWKMLYTNLVPVWGSEIHINAFQKANSDWTGLLEDRHDLRYSAIPSSIIKRGFEALLGGSFGSWFESRLRTIQLKRIEEKLRPKAGYKPRLICTDQELELHLDTQRIEEWRNNS